MRTKNLAKVFKAVANERRLLILKHLLEKRELTVGRISELIKLSFKSTSKHLSVLENANLVKSRQFGPKYFYSIDKDGPKKIIDILEKYI